MPTIIGVSCCSHPNFSLEVIVITYARRLYFHLCLFVCLLVCLSVCLFVCLFVCLTVCPSVDRISQKFIIHYYILSLSLSEVYVISRFSNISDFSICQDITWSRDLMPIKNLWLRQTIFLLIYYHDLHRT